MNEVEQLAAKIQQECRDEANALAVIQMTSRGLNFEGEAERDIFAAGVEAGISGAMLVLPRRFDLVPRQQ